MSLEIQIGADVQGAVTGVKNVQQSLADLATKGGTSIKALESSLKDFKQSLSVATDPKDITKLNLAIRTVQENIKQLKSAGIQNPLEGIVTGSQRAHSSLLRLSEQFDVIPGPVGRTAHSFDQLLQSYERIRATTDSSGAALAKFAEVITGPEGIVLAASLAVGVLSPFITELFKSGEAFSEAEIQAAKFALELKNVKDGVDAFQNFRDFETNIDKLKAKLQFGSGTKADILGLGFDKAANEKTIEENNTLISNELEKISNFRDRIFSFGSESGKKLLETFFPDISSEIPDELIGKLEKFDRDIINQIKSSGIEIDALRKQREKATRQNDALTLEAQIKAAEELKRQQEKADAETKKQMEKALREYEAIQARWAEVIRQTNERVRTAIQAGQPSLSGFTPLGFNVKDLSTINTQIAEITDQIEFLTKAEHAIPGISTDKEIAKLKEELDLLKKIAIAFPQAEGGTGQRPKPEVNNDAKDLARTISGTVTPAFDNLFSTILHGGNAMKAFFQGLIQGVEQLMSKLVSAEIEALVLQAITGGIGGVAKSALPGLGGSSTLPGRAGGGPVFGNTAYMVGERGPELFIPSSTGSIVPNNNLSSLNGSASQMIQVIVQGVVSGRDLKIIATRQDNKDGRNV